MAISYYLFSIFISSSSMSKSFSTSGKSVGGWLMSAYKKKHEWDACYSVVMLLKMFVLDATLTMECTGWWVCKL